MPSTVEYIQSLIKLFESRSAFVCVVELYADFDIRIERNKTENRLKNKPSKEKMGIQEQEEYLRRMESKHRWKSNEGEELHKNYLRIDNTYLSPDGTAQVIKDAFLL